ncbi:hypothetical protein HNQ59_000620 [Chitinivorax tropicus]|uniref:DUF4390 domain-containing protein n=1 Tax=Chitinivorax tropicus TaxID=714531 RepID=A0A840MLD1_9PROT|nr:DUF4390 domain-containing protein [Chitinivorax tropicus]MBB5017356.1 hypothetical protein [Chitinivorax tropicus]
MTVFITHCWRKERPPLADTPTTHAAQRAVRGLALAAGGWLHLAVRWVACLLAALLLIANPADAEGIVVQNASLQLQDDHYVVDATFNVTLNPTLDEVLHKGVPLYFLTEFEIVKPRWYWAYRQLASWFDNTARLEARLTYNALTRKYRVGYGSLYQSFSSLSQALSALGAVRNWSVTDAGNLTKGRQYEGRVRMRLDVSQLPKPFQINAIGTQEWDIASEWRNVAVSSE